MYKSFLCGWCEKLIKRMKTKKKDFDEKEEEFDFHFSSMFKGFKSVWIPLSASVKKEMIKILSTFLSLTLHLAAGWAGNTIVFTSSSIPTCGAKKRRDHRALGGHCSWSTNCNKSRLPIGQLASVINHECYKELMHGRPCQEIVTG